MPLQPGTRLGQYEVLSALGAGGMGEVWRARDTRLDRAAWSRSGVGTSSARSARFIQRPWATIGAADVEGLPMTRVYRVGAERRDEIVQELGRALVDEPRVAYAYVHGSFLEEPAFHDIDVAVSLMAGAASEAHLLVVLSESLSARLGLPVDVRALDEAPLAFRFHALRGRLLVNRDDERLARTIEDTTRRYLDVEPLLRVATREAFAS